MSRAAWTKMARGSAWASGVVVVALSLLLISDGFLEKRRAAVEEGIVAALEERIPTEAIAAEELAAATEIHTMRSVAREQRNVRLGWGLLVATIVFLSAAKGHQALRFARQPALVAIGSSFRAAAVAASTAASDSGLGRGRRGKRRSRVCRHSHRITRARPESPQSPFCRTCRAIFAICPKKRCDGCARGPKSSRPRLSEWRASTLSSGATLWAGTWFASVTARPAMSPGSDTSWMRCGVDSRFHQMPTPIDGAALPSSR